jgi:cytidylate kinase
LSEDRHRHVIAIDGPAASGKSSVARELARRLGFVYVNSGAMYRAVTWFALENDLEPDDANAVVDLVERAAIHCEIANHESRIRINDVDPTPHLRQDRVNSAVSRVSSIARVREILVAKMREYSLEHDIVIEGRDIGSVVFPDTPFKFYIDASPEVRSRRRAAEGLLEEIRARDQADSSRATAPLVVAKDAEFIDSSHIGVNEVVDLIVRRLREKGLLPAQ